MTAERLLILNRLDHRAESGKSTSQIRYSGSNPDLRSSGRIDHRQRLSIAERTQSTSAAPSIRTRACPKSMSMMPVRWGFALEFLSLACLVPTAWGTTFTGNSFDCWGTSNSPLRYCRRHLNNWLELMFCARATCATEAPGCNVSSTMARRCGVVRNRRTRPFAVSLLFLKIGLFSRSEKWRNCLTSASRRSVTMSSGWNRRLTVSVRRKPC